MRRIFALCGVLIPVVIAIVMANPVAWPPAGDIIPCEDLEGFDGFIEDVPGLVSIHIVLPYPTNPMVGGVTACQFSAPLPDCLDATYISDTQVFPVTLGNSQTGVAIGFGTCATWPVHVLTVHMFYNGTDNECCFMWIHPALDGASGEIELVDCQNTLFYGKGGAAIFNPDENDCMQFVSTQASTWGKVKSLYAE